MKLLKLDELTYFNLDAIHAIFATEHDDCWLVYCGENDAIRVTEEQATELISAIEKHANSAAMKGLMGP